MKKRVLITNILPPVAYQLLSKKYNVTWNKKPLTEEALAGEVGPYHALLTTLLEPVKRRVLEAATHLKCVANCAVGFDNIDIETAKRLGVWVTNTPDVLTEATADIAWALILSCARRLPEGESLVRKGKFKGWRPLMLLGRELQGKTLGIYGFGRIGQAVARRGRAWNMPILYHQRKRESSRVEKYFHARYVPFEDLLRNSDIVSVNVPLTPETRNRFTLREFKKMKKQAIFINTARGAIHREKDLAYALKNKVLFSAGLDVYESEPKIDRELLKLKNCTLLPHLGSATIETREAMATLAARNIDLVLSGKRPQTPVFQL